MVTDFLRKLAGRVPVPRSLLGRMLLLTLLAVLFAQALSSVIWVSQLRATQLEGLVTSARSLAHSMTASVSYFRSLPVAFRPLVLDQLRSMGGTRFVVTLNDKPLGMEVLPITPRKEAVLKAVSGRRFQMQRAGERYYEGWQPGHRQPGPGRVRRWQHLRHAQGQLPPRGDHGRGLHRRLRHRTIPHVHAASGRKDGITRHVA